MRGSVDTAWTMATPTRTPEGESNYCPVCGHVVCVEPSRPPGDAPCPFCGTLLWYVPGISGPVPTAWEYGVKLIQEGDRNAGLQLLLNVVAHRPNDVERRRELRTLNARARERRSAIGEAVSDVLQDVWIEIRRAKSKRVAALIDWDTIDRAAERGLAVAPKDIDLHLEVGHACRERGYVEAARFAYQCALDVAPGRPDVLELLTKLS